MSMLLFGSFQAQPNVSWQDLATPQRSSPFSGYQGRFSVCKNPPLPQASKTPVKAVIQRFLCNCAKKLANPLASHYRLQEIR
jgi:hypothetical protein